MNRKFRLFALLTVLCCCLGFASGQTNEQIKAARALAKQQGYSDAEIDKMLAGQQKGTATTGEKGLKTGEEEMMRTINKDGSMTVMRLDTTKFKEYARLDSIKRAEDQKIKIYGHDFFQSSFLTFIPSFNVPTPESYRLAPGDEVVLDIWGSQYLSTSQVISPEGSITIPEIGPVYLMGNTVREAEKYLRSYLSTYYAGLEGDKPTAFLRISLGKIRSLTINVVGDVTKPGTYSLPSLSSVMSALYMAGGPSEIGTLREVKIYRKNKLSSIFDMYGFFQDGKYDSNLRIEDDDIIKVGAYTNLVTIVGEVKRPMKYEMLDSENLETLIRYAGGFADAANTERVHVTRKKGFRRESFDVSSSHFGTFHLTDGDSLTVSTNIEDNLNRVYIEGAVWHQGSYAISDTLCTLQQLITSAGGLKDEAYSDRGYIKRLNEVRDSISIHFSVKDVMAGNEEVILFRDDSVRIFAHHELSPNSTILTYGELNKHYTISFRQGITLGDVILLSGGFSAGAAKNNIDVARRNFDNTSQAGDTIATIYNFNLLEHPEDHNFELAPYDMVFVRSLPNFKRQQAITIRGEVNFPGTYVVENNVVRISEVIQKAGGLNRDAYIMGATIRRRLSEQEYLRAKLATDIAKKQVGKDSLLISSVNRGDSYNVGLDLQAALDQPGTYADIVLREGDVIEIPILNNTVKISGGVLMSNVVPFNERNSVKDYIDQAGGYAKDAYRGRVYIVFMNNTAAAKGSKYFKPAPGCEIVVPQRDLSKERRISATEVMSIASSTASVAAMVVSMVNALK